MIHFISQRLFLGLLIIELSTAVLSWHAPLATPTCRTAWGGPTTKNWRALLPAPQSRPLNEIPEGMQRLATQVVLENLPHSYEDNDDWGMTRERFNGLKVRLDGLKIRTKRRRTTVNHGSWKRYRIQQIDPDQNLEFEIGPIRTLADSRAAFKIDLICRINGFARFSEWNRGVRVISISVDADAQLKLTLDCRLDVELDPRQFPPDIILQPEVVQANLRITEWKLNRISHYDGPIARELGRSLRRKLEKKVAEKQPELVAKINQQIVRHEDDLRISLHDAIKEKWKAFTAPPNSETRRSDRPQP